MSLQGHIFAATIPFLLCSGTFAHADDSTIDNSFAANAAPPGWARIYVSAGGTVDEHIVAARRTPDGSYVVVGSRAGGGAGALIFLAKLDADGYYNTSFGGTAATGNAGTGRVLKDAYLSSVKDMTIDSQGRIIVVGSTPGALGQADFGVVRFNANGSDDLTFAGDGGTGIAFDRDTAHSRASDVPNSVTTLPDGSVIVAGTIADVDVGTPFTSVGVVKLKPDGSRDTSFNNSGDGSEVFCRAQCRDVIGVARIVYDAPRNRLVIGGDHASGTNNSDWFVVTQDLASLSATTAHYAVDLGGASGYQLAYMTGLAVQNDGKIVAAGWANGEDLSSHGVVLRRMAGTTGEDTAFGNVPGRGLFVSPVSNDIYSDVASDGLGRPLLVGSYNSYGLVQRLTPAGLHDFSFNNTSFESLYQAHTSSDAAVSHSTAFKHVFLDGGRPVVAGEAPDASASDADLDLILTRLQTDVIFANSFE